jgi:hypothetical protein
VVTVKLYILQADNIKYMFFNIIETIVILIIIFVLYRIFKVRRLHSQLNNQLVGPLQEKLQKGEAITTEDVLPFAKNAITREATFKLLSNYKKTDLFPAHYYTIVKAAESNLSSWLKFPTELDAYPDEIEHMQRVTIDPDGKRKKLVHYEVFKYRVNAPHWASEDGWILGVVGPYYDNGKPYTHPHATFSRMSSTIDKVSPEEEALWVHNNIAFKKRWGVT